MTLIIREHRPLMSIFLGAAVHILFVIYHEKYYPSSVKIATYQNMRASCLVISVFHSYYSYNNVIFCIRQACFLKRKQYSERTRRGQKSAHFLFFLKCASYVMEKSSAFHFLLKAKRDFLKLPSSIAQ